MFLFPNFSLGNSVRKSLVSFRVFTLKLKFYSTFLTTLVGFL